MIKKKTGIQRHVIYANQLKELILVKSRKKNFPCY